MLSCTSPRRIKKNRSAAPPSAKPGSPRITVDDAERGLLMAVEHEATLHADRFESLAAGQRRVLSELARAGDPTIRRQLRPVS